MNRREYLFTRYAALDTQSWGVKENTPFWAFLGFCHILHFPAVPSRSTLVSQVEVLYLYINIISMEKLLLIQFPFGLTSKTHLLSLGPFDIEPRPNGCSMTQNGIFEYQNP